MEKYEQYARVFYHFDSNGPIELRQCVSSIGRAMTAEEAARAVELMDSDRDRLLCLENLVALVEGGGELERASDLNVEFELYALQGSGCITPKSLKVMLSRLGRGGASMSAGV